MRVYNKVFIRILAVISIILTVLTCSGCSKKNRIVGEYIGTQGSYIKLEKDGTCVYAEDDDTGIGNGVWYIEDDILYINVSNLDYWLFADISSYDDDLLLEADDYYSSWNDEYFTKIE